MQVHTEALLQDWNLLVLKCRQVPCSDGFMNHETETAGCCAFLYEPDIELAKDTGCDRGRSRSRLGQGRDRNGCADACGQLDVL